MERRRVILSVLRLIIFFWPLWAKMRLFIVRRNHPLSTPLTNSQTLFILFLMFGPKTTLVCPVFPGHKDIVFGVGNV